MSITTDIRETKGITEGNIIITLHQQQQQNIMKGMYFQKDRNYWKKLMKKQKI